MPSRKTLVLSLLGCLAFLLWLAALGFMSTVPLNGDEGSYNRNAEAIANFFLSRSDISFNELGQRLVGRGWFMPGLSFVLTPLYATDGTPGLAMIRAYMVGVNLLLWLWLLREVSTTFGRYAAIVLLIFPTLSVTWLMFTASTWADLPAGLFLAIVAARTYRLAVSTLAGQALPLRQIVMLELLMIIMVYLRGNFIAAVVAVHVFLAVLALISGHYSRLFQRVMVLAMGLILFSTLLAPWSLTASRTLGGAVVTTSSLPMSLAKTFGDRDELCFGPCAEGNIHFVTVEYSREYAERHGISELEAQKRMSAHALSGLTISGYLGQVQENFVSFLFQPSGFVRRFVNISSLDLSEDAAKELRGLAKVLTLGVHIPFLFALFAGNMVVVSWSRRGQIFSLVLKMFTLCLFVQPFIHVSHARYWVGFAPLMGLAVIFLAGMVCATDCSGLGVSKLRHVGAHVCEDGGGDKPSNSTGKVLVVIQAAYVCLITGTILVILTA